MPSESIRPSQPGASALQSLSGESRPSTRRAGFGQGLHATSPRRIVPKLARGSSSTTVCQFCRNRRGICWSLRSNRHGRASQLPVTPQHPFRLRSVQDLEALIHCRSTVTIAKPAGQHVGQPVAPQNVSRTPRDLENVVSNMGCGGWPGVAIRCANGTSRIRAICRGRGTMSSS